MGMMKSGRLVKRFGMKHHLATAWTLKVQPGEFVALLVDQWIGPKQPSSHSSLRLRVHRLGEVSRGRISACPIKPRRCAPDWAWSRICLCLMVI